MTGRTSAPPLRCPGAGRAHEAAPPALYPSVVTHVRTRPWRYTLDRSTYLWLVDLDGLPRLPRPLRPFARFEGRDHFAGRDRDIRAGLDRFLRAHGEDLRGGRVLMLGNARVLGHVFNPLTLFWCHDRDGELACVVAEVHNTYGERHGYLLRPGEQIPEPGEAPPPGGPTPATPTPAEFRTPKDFYVSPFFPVDGSYRMRVPLPDGKLALTVHLDRDGGSPFTATVRGSRLPGTSRHLVRCLLRHPWPTLAVTAAIRWHGVRLWLRGLPVRPRPDRCPQKGMQ